MKLRLATKRLRVMQRYLAHRRGTHKAAGHGAQLPWAAVYSGLSAARVARNDHNHKHHRMHLDHFWSDVADVGFCRSVHWQSSGFNARLQRSSRQGSSWYSVIDCSSTVLRLPLFSWQGSDEAILSLPLLSQASGIILRSRNERCTKRNQLTQECTFLFAACLPFALISRAFASLEGYRQCIMPPIDLNWTARGGGGRRCTASLLHKVSASWKISRPLSTRCTCQAMGIAFLRQATPTRRERTATWDGYCIHLVHTAYASGRGDLMFLVHTAHVPGGGHRILLASPPP